MSGFQEILVVAAVVLAVIFLPRLRDNREDTTEVDQAAVKLTGRLRLAIAASVIYPVLVAAVIRPWEGDPTLFIFIGLGPVALAWLLYWVIIGFRKKNN